MVAVPDRRERHPVLPRSLDRPVHGEANRHLTHGVAAVHNDGATDLARHPRPATRIDPVARQLLRIVRHPQHAVAVDAALIGRDQRGCQEVRILGTHSHRLEDAPNLLPAGRA